MGLRKFDGCEDLDCTEMHSGFFLLPAIPEVSSARRFRASLEVVHGVLRKNAAVKVSLTHAYAWRHDSISFSRVEVDEHVEEVVAVSQELRRFVPDLQRTGGVDCPRVRTCASTAPYPVIIVRVVLALGLVQSVGKRE